MQAVVGRQKGGHGPGGSMRRPWKLGMRRRLALRDAVFYEERVLARIAPYVHLTCKEVDRFRKGSVHEFYCLKTSQVNKVHLRNALVR